VPDELRLRPRGGPDALEPGQERGGLVVGVEVELDRDTVGFGDRAQDAVPAYAVVRAEALVAVESRLPGVEVLLRAAD